MKFNYKSRKGFTLIELLVVIGILAVLAAIAIPSVAGLIDRANVSADNTNANEYTNAIERFASEYELYCQDIASGILKDDNGDGIPDNMDAAQGRVYNVTGAVTRADITALESGGLAGKQINRDTKYPSNTNTIVAIVQNYTKTSSSIFEPKQSDCHYYYSPDCGIIVCAEAECSSIAELNKLVISGKDAKGNALSDHTVWIDITENKPVSLVHNIIVPEGGQYITANGQTINNGNEMQSINWNDVYYYGDYKYVYLYESHGWKVELNPSIVTRNQSTYGPILNEINGKPVTSLYRTFANCANLTTIPTIPSSVLHMHGTFENCTSLVDTSSLILPSNLRGMGTFNINNHSGTFAGCTNLKYAPQIPNSVELMDNTFKNCTSLIEMPSIKNDFNKAVVFAGCTQFGY